MDWRKTITLIWSWVIDAAPVAGALIAAYVYWHTVRRDKKIETIKKLSELRDKYPQKVSNDDILNYLRDMEYFCTGINEGIYDLKIVKKMSGKRLLRQYDEYIQATIAARREQRDSEIIWKEYEEVMQKLNLMYTCKGCIWRKWFCRKCR